MDNFINSRSITKADSVRTQLERIMTRFSFSMQSTPFHSSEYYANIRRCLLAGFFMQVAHRQATGHYLTLKDNQVVVLHPSCVPMDAPEWVVYHEFVLTSKNFIRAVSSVEPEWMFDASEKYFDLESFPAGPTKVALQRAKRTRGRAAGGATPTSPLAP